MVLKFLKIILDDMSIDTIVYPVQYYLVISGDIVIG